MVRFTNQHGITWSDRDIRRVYDEAARPFMEKAVTRYIAIIRELMTMPKTGRMYYSGGRLYQASAPGEPPAVASGLLLNTLKGKVVHGGSNWKAVFQSEAHYMEWLEKGTARMEPRPMWQVALLLLRREMGL